MAEITRIRVLASIDDIDAAAWDACADPAGAPGRRAANPFVAHRFLAALERSGSVAPAAGWAPRHLIAEDAAGRAVGVMPLYLKGDSYGEYVFDHAWAEAYQRAGGRYYPKLLCGVPFTPVPGPRLMAHPDADAAAVRRALIEGAAQMMAEGGYSSLHVNFCTKSEQEALAGLGLAPRLGVQYHWTNAGYADFDDFLGALASRKRKQIRKERAAATANGVEIRALTGDQIASEDWEALWGFYQDTGARKWGRPYLTRAFFDEAARTMAADTLLVMVHRGGRRIAGALNFIGADTLYGRYWGCVEDHPALHFEACYYQAIDFAIARGLRRVEAGAQGDHKLARGYAPVETCSAHLIAHAGLRAAVADYLERERAAVREEAAMLHGLTPFRKTDAGSGDES